MNFLSVFLCMVFGAAMIRRGMPTSITLVYHPSEKLPKVPVWTKCGLMSKSSIDDVRNLFSSFRGSVANAETLFKILRMDSADISPPRMDLNTSHSNLDPYTQDSGCWLDHNESVRIYLDAQILRKFVDPLINISVSEFEKGLAEGGNSSNAGLAVATIVDKLIKAISQLDCVIEATNISVKNLSGIKSPRMEPRPEPTTDKAVIVMKWLQLRDTKIAVKRAHNDLKMMMGPNDSQPIAVEWNGPDKCRYN